MTSRLRASATAIEASSRAFLNALVGINKDEEEEVKNEAAATTKTSRLRVSATASEASSMAFLNALQSDDDDNDEEEVQAATNPSSGRGRVIRDTYDDDDRMILLLLMTTIMMMMIRYDTSMTSERLIRFH